MDILKKNEEELTNRQVLSFLTYNKTGCGAVVGPSTRHISICLSALPLETICIKILFNLSVSD